MDHDLKENSCCAHDHAQTPKAFWKKPLVWLLGFLVILILLSFKIEKLVSFRIALMNYLNMMAWPVGLGLLLGGVIDYFVPSEYISKYLAHSRKRTIFYSVGFGFLMSACSHGILALSMQLHKKGASHAAVISFLLASPWANLPVTLLLIGFFKWKSIVIILSAILVAINTGLIFQILERKGWVEKGRHTVEVAHDFSIRRDIQERIKNYKISTHQLQLDFLGIIRGAISLADMVLFWLLLGMVMASLASTFVPHDIFHQYLGPTALGLVCTMILATLMEVCSEGTSPLAFELYKQTGAFGNAFAFLMGGVVTDYTEIGLVWSNLGKKTALWMVLVSLPQVILLGWLFNRIF